MTLVAVLMRTADEVSVTEIDRPEIHLIIAARSPHICALRLVRIRIPGIVTRPPSFNQSALRLTAYPSIRWTVLQCRRRRRPGGCALPQLLMSFRRRRTVHGACAWKCKPPPSDHSATLVPEMTYGVSGGTSKSGSHGVGHGSIFFRTQSNPIHGWIQSMSNTDQSVTDRLANKLHKKSHRSRPVRSASRRRTVYIRWRVVRHLRVTDAKSWLQLRRSPVVVLLYLLLAPRKRNGKPRPRGRPVN